MSTVISVENLSKSYRLGQISTGTLSNDLKRWWARQRGKPDPFQIIGEADHGNRQGETLWALKDINLQVQQGEVLGIIGRNGAGKSTLLKILSEVTAPTSGDVKVKGRIASLLEVGTGFHPDLTGRENIFLNGVILGMNKAEITRKFDEIVDFSGIERFINTPVKRYSSGMYVRLAFAVAAHLEPEILLLDEVLAVGDTEFQKKCLGKMGEVAKEGRTVLFVSHNMAAIQGLCSRCYLLGGGKRILEGSPKNVIEHYLVNLLQDASISLNDRKDRKGSGEVVFTKVSVLDSKGKPTDHVLSGQDVVIAIDYHSRDGKPVSRLDVHVTMYTPLGQFLFNCSSEGSGYLFNHIPPQGRAMCCIPELPLAPGRYIFNLYATIGGTVADWVQQAGYLDVDAGDYFGTGQLKTHEEGFLVKHKWSIEKP